MNAADAFDLLDWKRRIFAAYAEVRASAEPTAAWAEWRRTRDALFRDHPQSPIPAERRASFAALPFYDYDPVYRVLGHVRPAEERTYDIATSGGETMVFARFAYVDFALGGIDISLELYWLDAYGGGLFLPFRDGTSGRTTYGAGRYLFDTVKGADLGMEDGELILDFNFSYNPSCSYDPRWVCPLAPPPNRIEHALEAGEKHVDRGEGRP